MFGRHSILGRTLVIHAGEDDLGQNSDDGSKKTGNAGPRLTCALIEKEGDDKESFVFGINYKSLRSKSCVTLLLM